MLIFLTNQRLDISRNAFLYDKLCQRYKSNVHLIFSARKNFIYRNFELMAKLIYMYCISILRNDHFICIIGFQSRILVPVLFFLKKLTFFKVIKVIYDFGYPFDQAFKVSRIRKFVGSVIDRLSFCFDLVLFESTAQLEYCINKYKLIDFLNLSVLYYLPRTYDSKYKIEREDYFLFRGVMNSETNVNYIAAEYRKYISMCSDKNVRPYKLIFMTRSSFENYNDIISVDSKWYHEEHLNSAIKSSIAMIGQMSDNDRIKLTIPHKAFEACMNNVLYITKRSSSIEEVFGNFYDGYFEGDLSAKLLNITFNGPANYNNYSDDLVKKSSKQLRSIWEIVDGGLD